MQSARGSGADKKRMKGWAPSRISMARIMAPKAISTTPDRYQITTGMTATATTISVRLRNSTWLVCCMVKRKALCRVEYAALYRPGNEPPAERGSVSVY